VNIFLKIKIKFQTIFCQFYRIFFKFININDFIKAIEKYEYVLIKTDAKHFQKDFIDNFSVGKDLDIIASKKDYNKIVNILLGISKKTFKNCNIIEKDNKQNYKLRIEKYGCLIIQFDISKCNFYNLDENYIIKAIKYKVRKDNYYILPVEYELLFRLEEIKQNPYKEHHKEFIILNKQYLSNLHNNYKNIIKEIIN